MTGRRGPGACRRALAAGVSLLLAGGALAGCTEVESATPAGYEPSHLEPVAGTDSPVITFTREGAERTGLRTAKVQERDGVRRVPYAALIYDGEGASHVYASPDPLTYERSPVTVDRIEGQWVLLRSGPPAGADVVTVGATEVYGAELEIAGSH